jgi:predicted MFS family arabinose efflux permease
LPEHSWLIAGLSLTRLIGWGANYWAPSVLASHLARDPGLSAPVVFGGITVLLVTGALLAVPLGRHAERHGTRGLMVVGAAICGVGFVGLAAVQGPLGYLAAWAVIGVGHAMSLANMGSVTVAQIMDVRARRVIGVMMLVGGLSATVFWPFAAWLADVVGWRGACLVFAALHVGVALPIHLAIPRHRRPPTDTANDPGARLRLDGRVPGERRRIAFVLLAGCFCLSGLVSWGLPLHMIAMFETSGLSLASAVAIASLGGPVTLAARLVEVAAGDRVPLEKLCLAALLMGAVASLVQLTAGGSAATTVLFVVLYSAGAGVISIARATLPLVLFGQRGYAVMSSRLVMPQNLMFAAAPLLYAWLITATGETTTLIVSAALQGLAFIAMLLLLAHLSRS